MNILNEFKKIDMPWVLEVITERFDFLPIDAMTDMSIVYGGAIRDALAGIKLEGDLDIVVSNQDTLQVMSAIGKSAKWTRVAEENPGLGTIGPPSYSVDDKTGKMMLKFKAAYGDDVPMDKLIRFVNQQDVEIELMVAKSGAGDTEACIIDVPKNVDIICCGLAMDKDGDIFEIVKGAYDQCKERVLRFNEAVADIVDIPRMEKRIEKLVKRGYTSEIDVDAIKKKQKKFAKKNLKPKKVKANNSIRKDILRPIDPAKLKNSKYGQHKVRFAMLEELKQKLLDRHYKCANEEWDATTDSKRSVATAYKQHLKDEIETVNNNLDQLRPLIKDNPRFVKSAPVASVSRSAETRINFDKLERLHSEGQNIKDVDPVLLMGTNEGKKKSYAYNFKIHRGKNEYLKVADTDDWNISEPIHVDLEDLSEPENCVPKKHRKKEKLNDDF